MAYVVNVAITDTFILRDNSNAAITGKVFADFATVEAYEVGTPATTAVVTVTEVGAGEYRISFTPTTPTSGSDISWTSHIVYNSGGVFREFSETYLITAVASTVVAVSSAASGALTQTLVELRRRVADRFEDYVPLTATANGTTTTLLDTANVNAGEQHYNGAQIVCLNGTNIGLVRTVTGTDTTTGTLTLNAALTLATATNDTFDVHNRTGRKFKKAQYDRAINAAINDAFPMAVVAVKGAIVAAFDAEVPEITVPAAVTEVHSLEVQDSNSDWHTIPKAGSRGGDGWFADASDGTLRLNGYRAWTADTLTLRVFGYGRQPALTADSDTCAIDAEFIVARAAYHLALGNVGQDDMAVRVNIFRDESERARVRIARLRAPWSQKVRAS